MAKTGIRTRRTHRIRISLRTTCRALSALALGAALCGGVAQAADKTIGMAFPAADHGWLGAVIADAKDEAAALHVKSVITTAGDPNKQTNDVEDLISKKVDAVVILPIETDAMTQVAAKLKAAHIPVVILDRELNTQDFTALIKGDNVGVGLNAGKYIARALGGKGNVVEISGVPSSVTTQRSQGFRDGIKGHPGIRIVASQPGDFQREKSLTVMQNILQSQPHIDAVYTQDDEMALGVLQAIKEAKRTDIKIVTGVGGDKEVYKLIAERDPLMKATFVYSPLMAKQAVKMAVDIANGRAPKQKITTAPGTQVTIDNVKQFYDPNANY
jgi:ribose transport system substrate-binding protein